MPLPLFYIIKLTVCQSKSPCLAENSNQISRSGAAAVPYILVGGSGRERI